MTSHSFVGMTPARKPVQVVLILIILRAEAHALSAEVLIKTSDTLKAQ